MGIEQLTELRRRLEREDRSNRGQHERYATCPQCGHFPWRHLPLAPGSGVRILACSYRESKTGEPCHCVIDC